MVTRRRSRRLIGAILGVTIAVAVAGCDGYVIEQTSPDNIVVGSAPFAESELVAALYAQALTTNGYTARVDPPLANREGYFPVLEKGAIGVVPEYVGALLTYLDPAVDDSPTPPDSTQALRALRSRLPAELAVGDHSRVQNRDLLVVTRQFAQDRGIGTIGQLAPVCGDLTFGGPKTFDARYQGLRGLSSVYGCTFARTEGFVTDDSRVLVDLMHNRLQVARWFETSPELDNPDLVTLDDDRKLFLDQRILPLYRRDTVTSAQLDVLNRVSAQLTTAAVREMLRAKEKGESTADLAREWVARHPM